MIPARMTGGAMGLVATAALVVGAAKSAATAPPADLATAGPASVEAVRPVPADTSAAERDEDGAETGLVLSYPRLLIPVQGVRRADLVDTYRHAREAGRRHNAIDIHAPRGTPVLAAAEGTVVRLFESEPGGTTLYKLDPNERIIYYYAHLDGYAPGIREGARVARGDTIAFVGDTGNARPGDYHLHFAVSTTRDPERWWGGRPTNPYPLLVDAGGLAAEAEEASEQPAEAGGR